MKKAGEFLLPCVNRLVPKRIKTIFDIWEQVGGDVLREHSKVLDIRDTTLLVHVDSPAYLSYASMRKSYYEKALQRAIIALELNLPIRDIRFIIAPRS